MSPRRVERWRNASLRRQRDAASAGSGPKHANARQLRVGGETNTAQRPIGLDERKARIARDLVGVLHELDVRRGEPAPFVRHDDDVAESLEGLIARAVASAVGA